MTVALHQAEPREPTVTRRGSRAIVEAWPLDGYECVLLPHGFYHGWDCPDQQRARARILARAEPEDALEKVIWRQGKATAKKHRPEPVVEFRVTHAETGRFVWASHYLGDDVGAAVALAFRVAQTESYFIGVAVGGKEAEGVTIDELDKQWQMRRCARCAARCVIPTGTDLCPQCGGGDHVTEDA